MKVSAQPLGSDVSHDCRFPEFRHGGLEPSLEGGLDPLRHLQGLDLPAEVIEFPARFLACVRSVEEFGPRLLQHALQFGVVLGDVGHALAVDLDGVLARLQPVGADALGVLGVAERDGAADRNQRDAILIEKNPVYAAMAAKRIDKDVMPLFASA